MSLIEEWLWLVTAEDRPPQRRRMLPRVSQATGDEPEVQVAPTFDAGGVRH